MEYAGFVVIAVFVLGFLFWERTRSPEHWDREIERYLVARGNAQHHAVQWRRGKKRTFHIGGMPVDKDERLATWMARVERIDKGIDRMRKLKAKAEARRARPILEPATPRSPAPTPAQVPERHLATAAPTTWDVIGAKALWVTYGLVGWVVVSGVALVLPPIAAVVGLAWFIVPGITLLVWQSRQSRPRPEHSSATAPVQVGAADAMVERNSRERDEQEEQEQRLQREKRSRRERLELERERLEGRLERYVDRAEEKEIEARLEEIERELRE